MVQEKTHSLHIMNYNSVESADFSNVCFHNHEFLSCLHKLPQVISIENKLK